MPRIKNSTVNINYYLDAGGKVDLIEEEAQKNVSFKLGDEVLYKGKSSDTITIPLASENDIDNLFKEAES